MPRAITFVLTAAALVCSACTPESVDPQAALPEEPPPVTVEEVRREVRRLPPMLREQFESGAGQDEMLRALRDKRLLAFEARQRGLHEDPEIARQVTELEERLIIQKLLADEEKARPYSEDELRAYYDEHKQDFAQPDVRRVARVLARARGNSDGAREDARRRAEAFREELVGGKPIDEVARKGDGPERVRGGDLGLVAADDARDARQTRAVFRLKKAGDISRVVEVDDGFAVLQLLEHRDARVPPFAEVRSEVEARFLSRHKRRVFDEVIRELRERQVAKNGGHDSAEGAR